MTSGMPGEECSGEGPNHMASDMKGQGSKLQDKQYARGEKVTMGVRLHLTILVFFQFCLLLGTWGFWPLVTFCTWAYHFCSAYVCLTAYYINAMHIINRT